MPQRPFQLETTPGSAQTLFLCELPVYLRALVSSSDATPSRKRSRFFYKFYKFMAQPNILRSYARRSDPSTLPSSILFSHTDKTLTIFDAYPKSIFHFLILPRSNAYPPLTVSELANLRGLLRSDKERARQVIQDLDEAAQECRVAIEEEMLVRYGFKWDVWIGFHPVPSMEHLHLHVVSADLCSSAMKNKKHYNSFHPKVGFFVKLKDVVSWFEAKPSFFAMMAELKKTQYEPMLKEELSCFRCRQPFRTMVKLKEHLQEEWDKEARKEKAKHQRRQASKRKLAEYQGHVGTSESPGASNSPTADNSPPDPSPKRRRDERCG